MADVIETPILAPAAVLVLWTLIMLVWVALTRFPALSKLGMTITKLPAGGRGQNLDAILPAAINWKSHNYTHLHEQPTLFYAIVIILALIGQGHGLNLWLAWAYVALRIAHSLWQALVNTLPVRFSLFLLSTFCLLGLTLHAVIALI